MWRYFVPVAVFVLLAVFFYGGLYRDPTAITSPLLGKPAPQFSLPSLKNPAAAVRSEDFLGHVSLLNVWGTWCIECRHEHAFLLELAKSSGVPIYGLNLRDDRDAALRWLATLGDPYVASAFDPEGLVAIDWGVYGAPETFLIGPDGMVLYKHISPMTARVWERDFAPIIAAACADQPCGPRASR